MLTSERLPQFDRKTLFAVLVKAVFKVDASAFVVPAEKKEVFRIFDFVGEKRHDVFDILFTAIDVISQEEIIRFWGKTSVLKES